MSAVFERPWALLALPVALALIALPVFLRRQRPPRLKLHATLRAVTALLLVLSLAGMGLPVGGARAQLMVLADRSDSMTAQLGGEEALVGEIEANKGDRDTALLSFGGDAALEYLRGNGHFAGFETQVQANATDAAAALTMGAALLSQDASRHMLLLSDGRQTRGDILQAARLLAAQGIRLDAVYLGADQNQDAQLTSLQAPGYLHLGERYEVVATVHASYGTAATLRLFQDRVPVAERSVTLSAGENRFVFSLTAQEEGIHTYTAEVSAAGDASGRNNSASAYTRIIGRPRILLVGAPEQTANLASLLDAAGMVCEVKPPAQLTERIEDYMVYQAAVLCDVSADALPAGVQAALGSFVRNLGRGLLVGGGQNSYALGNYSDTALEELLPLKSTLDNQLNLPKLGLCLVIDHSGSMDEAQYGVSKRELAIEAAIRSTKILQTKDEIGVIAYDDQWYWAVKLQAATDRTAIENAISSIPSGGGTMMHAPMAAALAALQSSDAQLKHIILVTDGLPADSGFDQLAAQMQQSDITLTTVSIGKDADQNLMQRLAQLGGGRCYAVDQFSNIVSIFTKETMLATGAYLQNRTFTPAATPYAPAMLSSGFPLLHGYVNTTAKTLAEVQLVSDQQHPLYARWRTGLGRVACWTSDFAGLWSTDLMASAKAVNLVGSLVQQVLPEESGSGSLEVTRTDGGGAIALEAPTGEGASASATVIAPDGTTTEVPLMPSQPGRYEANFAADQSGVYVVRATNRADGVPDTLTEGALSAGWSAEYDLRAADGRALLEQAVQLTGGKLVTTAAEALAQQAPRQLGRVDLSGALLAAALALFLLQIAAARLRWDALVLAWATTLPARLRALRGAALHRRNGPKPQRGAVPRGETAALAREPKRKMQSTELTTPAGNVVAPVQKPAVPEVKAPQDEKVVPKAGDPTSTPTAAQALLQKRKEQKREQ